MSHPDWAAEPEGPLGLLNVDCMDGITFSPLIIQVIIPITG